MGLHKVLLLLHVFFELTCHSSDLAGLEYSLCCWLYWAYNLDAGDCDVSLPNGPIAAACGQAVPVAHLTTPVLLPEEQGDAIFLEGVCKIADQICPPENSEHCHLHVGPNELQLSQDRCYFKYFRT